MLNAHFHIVAILCGLMTYVTAASSLFSQPNVTPTATNVEL